MTANLPAGIVTNTPTITDEIHGFSHIDEGDIFQLWRVYTTNQNLLPNDAGQRLANFFWRLLSHHQLCQSLSGATVARLFMGISEDRAVLRTTPTQSPRSDRPFDLGQSLREVKQAQQQDQTQATTRHTGPKVDNDRQWGEADRTEATTCGPALRPRNTKASTVLPSILKKPRENSNEEITAGTVTTGAFPPGDSANTGSLRMNAQESDGTRSTVAEGLTHTERGGNAKKKKASFVVGTTSSRRRPMALRRKSSQSSSSDLSSVQSPIMTSVEGTEAVSEDSATRPRESVNDETRSQLESGLPTELPSILAPDLPRKSSPVYAPSPPSLQDIGGARHSGGAKHGDVVDSRSRKAKAPVLPATLVSSKTAATRAAVSTAASGTLDLASLPLQMDKSGRGPSPPTAGSNATTVMQGQGRGDPPGAPLSRTQSQLTLVLEKDRRHTDHKM
ncbi:MAG: hypothetical protein M1817_000856 [Caeruleum heppii]|nr:MAG: hypothetical protein M1817_000856 [Caeruleum heppii]